jgi:RING-H2 zinc finger domain
MMKVSEIYMKQFFNRWWLYVLFIIPLYAMDEQLQVPIGGIMLQESHAPINSLYQDDTTICGICQEEFEIVEDHTSNEHQDISSIHEIKILPCGHIFHIPCINRWASHNTICPLCRLCFIEKPLDESNSSNNVNIWQRLFSTQGIIAVLDKIGMACLGLAIKSGNVMIREVMKVIDTMRGFSSVTLQSSEADGEEDLVIRLKQFIDEKSYDAIEDVRQKNGQALKQFYLLLDENERKDFITYLDQKIALLDSTFFEERQVNWGIKIGCLCATLLTIAYAYDALYIKKGPSERHRDVLEGDINTYETGRRRFKLDEVWKDYEVSLGTDREGEMCKKYLWAWTKWGLPLLGGAIFLSTIAELPTHLEERELKKKALKRLKIFLLGTVPVPEELTKEA